ncbi:MAG: hypothetical protein ABL994_21870 [Verrucomicrobiales bacterium]
MKLSAPTQVFFIISVVLAALALLGKFAVVAAVAPYSIWLAIAAWAVLAIGSLMKGA